MQRFLFEWLGHDWLALRVEGRPELDAGKQVAEIFERCDAELRWMGLSLADTMRTRLWARSRESRDEGSRVRAATLAGAARSASSSFIAEDSLDSAAAVAVELWAMRPAGPESQKRLVEYEPAIVPLRYLVRDSVVALSGVTSVLPSLAEQIAEILAGIEGTLTHAGGGWGNVVKISCLLHRSQSLQELRSLLAPVMARTPAQAEYGFADGYSSPGKLVEVEVTARLSP